MRPAGTPRKLISAPTTGIIHAFAATPPDRRKRQSTAASRAGCDHTDADGSRSASVSLGVLYRDSGRLADADKAFSEALTIHRET